MSLDRDDGTPRPFSALSALASSGDDLLYTVEDSFFHQSRIFAIDTRSMPYKIIEDMRVVVENQLLLLALNEDETAVLLNDDNAVNIGLGTNLLSQLIAGSKC